MAEMNVVKTNIKPEDVAKVMKEYDKKATAPKVVSPGLDTVPKTDIGAIVKAKHKELEPKKEEKSKVKVPPKVISGKKIVIDLSTVNIDVKFTGTEWRPMDIKMANAALIRAFKIKVRDEYRRGIK